MNPGIGTDLMKSGKGGVKGEENGEMPLQRM